MIRIGIGATKKEEEIVNIRLQPANAQVGLQLYNLFMEMKPRHHFHLNLHLMIASMHIMLNTRVTVCYICGLFVFEVSIKFS